MSNPILIPSIWRRLACMLYEALLLFSVVFVSAWLFDTLTDSRDALKLRHVRQAWLFSVIGIYFVFFWCRGGQTLAMKTWRIRVLSVEAKRLSPARATARYVLAWMWFLPAMAVGHLLHLSGWRSLGLICVGLVLWLLPTLVGRDKQFLHDRLAGTQLVDAPKNSVAPV